MSNKTIDFIIIGAMKSGTTTIQRILKQHPEISFSSIKEPHYFTNGYRSVAKNINEYHELFSFEEGEHVKYGEASTTYTFFPEYEGIPERIHAYNPDVKLIYVLRNPVDRIESNYGFRLSHGHKVTENIVFEDPTIIQRSLYHNQISQYLEFFDLENIHIAFFEDFLQDKNQFLKEIFNYLEVSDLTDSIDQDIWANPSGGSQRINPTGVKINKSIIGKLVPKEIKNLIRPFFTFSLSEKPVLSYSVKEQLLEKLLSDIESLEILLEKDLSHWKVIK